CYATQNRQIAVKKLAEDADLVIVVGSKNSSNSQRLVEVALAASAPKVQLIDHAEQIKETWLQDATTVGSPPAHPLPRSSSRASLSGWPPEATTTSKTSPQPKSQQPSHCPRNFDATYVRKLAA
ncbi:fructose-specific component phosphotransferase system IIB-like protein, partial [Streptomyces spectabilis]|nr:fructose-specific component phosphotransferase system IIB-like protein [Streptomyces spectabilis]